MNPDDSGLFSKEELESLMAVFLDQATMILETANKSLLELEENPADTEALRRLQRALHTLKGDANSVGFDEVGTIAHKLEDLLALMDKVGLSIERGVLDLLLFGVDALGDTLQRKRQAPAVALDISLILARLDQFMQRYCEQQPATPTPPATTLKLSEYQTLQVQAACAEGRQVVQVEAKFDEDCLMHVAGALILLRQLQQVGSIIATLPNIDDDKLLEASHQITVVMLTEDVEAAQQAALVAGVISVATVKPLVLEDGKVIFGQTSLLSATTVATAPIASTVAPEATTSLNTTVEAATSEVIRTPKQTTSEIEILRVDAAKVDMLMDLVGELVISRSMLNQIFNQLKREFPKNELVGRLGDTDSYIGRVLGELQKGVMKVRMVSLDQMFNRFFRIVRDLARESGKQIHLEVTGEETELDKRVVDIIYEPLLHLVRNAVDHGIESDEVRSRNGKPTRGHILLRAYHQGDQVIIEVQDDGRGIDVERLKNKAIEKRLRVSEDIRSLQGQDALELVFLNGLSTADRVTEISGRGIGMDVVKNVIEGLKGSIEIWTEVGKGTRFTLRMPLTLAIIKAMLFTVEERVFAIPLSSVLEISRVRREQLQQIGRHRVYNLRDTLYSLLELDQLLLRTPRTEPRDNPFILIVGLGERRVGLVADKVIGEREIVVKAVDKEWISSELITGASLLGDGRVVLILDISILLRRAVTSARVSGEES
ncbi:MAG: chemotaxis protein CheA [Acidobacteriota bacterium]